MAFVLIISSYTRVLRDSANLHECFMYCRDHSILSGDRVDNHDVAAKFYTSVWLILRENFGITNITSGSIQYVCAN